MRLALAAVLALSLILAAPATAADPGRWSETGFSRIPYVYYQGITSDDGGHFFFDGFAVGLYRTDLALAEQARNDAAIPPTVFAAEQYNHIGDITFDAAEGGRVLLPLECYTPGGPNGGNTCGTGSIGVADPATLAWRYHVKLDPAEIAKAMWAEVSPDGQLVWTSSGDDLLAYSAAEIAPARAAPAGAPLRAVRRLAGAVPPTGITGATFFDGRLFLAGQDSDLFQVWSVDVATGARQLEIERRLYGESEGLDVVPALGGVLHWMVTPLDPQGRAPTYGTSSNVLLHFVPRGIGAGSGVGTTPGPLPQLHLSARPRRLVAGRRTRVRFRAWTVVNGRRVPAVGARIRVARQRAFTGPSGSVRIALRPHRAGRLRPRASRSGARATRLTLRVTRRPARF
jgi:hypothetical protein